MCFSGIQGNDGVQSLSVGKLLTEFPLVTLDIDLIPTTAGRITYVST